MIIIFRIQLYGLLVQSSLQARNNTGILNTCTRLWQTESEQTTPVDSIKNVVRSSKAGELISQNVREITIKMNTTVRKPLMMKINKLRLRNLDNKHLKKVGGHIGRNVVEITIKMKTIVRKPLMIKINKLCLRNLDNKHLKKVGGHIGRNVDKITIKMNTIVRKSLMIRINKFRLRNLDNEYSIKRKKLNQIK